MSGTIQEALGNIRRLSEQAWEQTRKRHPCKVFDSSSFALASQWWTVVYELY